MTVLNNIPFFPVGAAVEESWLAACAHKGLYVHVSPERLYVASPDIEGSAVRAEYLKVALERMPGVTRVDASAATGRIVIDFDPGVQTASTIVDRLDLLLNDASGGQNTAPSSDDSGMGLRASGAGMALMSLVGCLSAMLAIFHRGIPR